MGLPQKDKVPKQKKCHCEPNVTKLSQNASLHSKLSCRGVPHIRFHDLRHSCATLLFAQGVPMKEIQAWLGHSTIGTTANIYTHLDENSKINSANAIIGIWEQKTDTQSISSPSVRSQNGAANGNRTRTVFGPRDFKSLVSTSSTMAACFHPIS